jgi:carotenoid cleavage dioxygenase-like enzyme
VGKSPYLEGSFAPVADEIAVERLAVVGELPAELDGTYLRNGPNPQFPPLGRHHWADGDGMVHAIELGGGRATYRNRWVRTKGFELERKRGRALWTGQLERPQLDHPDGATKSTANTSLVFHAGRLLALQDQGDPYELAPGDLATRGPYTFGRRLRHALCAHPKIDPASGELFAFGVSPIAKPHLAFSTVARDGELTHTTTLDLPGGVWMHDFAVTDRWAVFMNHPYTYDIRRLLRGEPLAAFQPERGSFLGLLPKRASGNEVRWFAVAPCFALHVVNAWDDADDAVVVEACHRWSIDPLAESEGRAVDRPVLWRWRIELRSGRVREEQLDDRPAELPRIHDGYAGRRARFAYAARLRDDVQLPLASGLLKYDLRRGGAEEHAHGAGCNGGEAVFVPRPGARDEDDGWMLFLVHDEIEARSELRVVDANDFTAPPRARVILPQRVPHGFHGLWLARAALERSA